MVQVRVKCKKDLNASRALLVLEHTILKGEGRPSSYSVVAVVPLRSHPYADLSLDCKNGVSVALHNCFLSIIIFKRDRSSLAADVPGHKGVSVASVLLVIEHNNIEKDRAFDIY